MNTDYQSLNLVDLFVFESQWLRLQSTDYLESFPTSILLLENIHLYAYHHYESKVSAAHILPFDIFPQVAVDFCRLTWTLAKTFHVEWIAHCRW